LFRAFCGYDDARANFHLILLEIDFNGYHRFRNKNLQQFH